MKFLRVALPMIMALSAGRAEAAHCERDQGLDRALNLSTERLTKCELGRAERAFEVIAPTRPATPLQSSILFAQISCGDDYAIFRAVVTGCFGPGTAEGERFARDLTRELDQEAERIVREHAKAAGVSK